MCSVVVHLQPVDGRTSELCVYECKYRCEYEGEKKREGGIEKKRGRDFLCLLSFFPFVVHIALV